MRKFASLFTLLMLFSALAIGQTRTVSGHVTDDKGDGVPFATITETGTANAVRADVSGMFSIKIKSGSQLTITASGMKDQTITPGTGLNNLTMVTDVAELKEVVVTTAFNIKKSQRTTPFSAQVITSENLNIVPQTNLNAALAGKVAGVQFRGQSPMKLSSQGFLRIRGGLSLSDVGAVYVVDGTIVNSLDINPDDVQDLTVLKGANATALFGEAAKNGAIVITTRKKGDKGTAGIEFSQGVTIDKVYLTPKYQNLYGGGADAEFNKFIWKAGMPMEWQALDGKYYHDYVDDASWGPRMVGQEYIPWYAWYGGHSKSFQTGRYLPQPSNMKDFWETGVTSTTNVSFSKQGPGFSSRVSYTNNYINGMLPNSSSEKHTIFTTAQMDLNDHFSIGANVTFVNNKIGGEFDDGYANNSAGSFNQWFHRDLDINKMKELSTLRSPLGTFASWNLRHNPNGYLQLADPTQFYKGNYWYNFYTYFDNIDFREVRDRIYGDVYIKYSVNRNLTFKGTVRKNQLNTMYENIVKSIIQESALQSGYLASYSTGETRSDIMNYELQASYSNKFFRKLDVSANAGGNLNRTRFNNVTMSTRNGLNVPDLYAITNSKDPINYGNTRQQSKVRSLFAAGDFEWDRIASFTWAVRNDWYSTLPTGNNSLLSPAFGAGFVFSEFTKTALPWLSFGKAFGSWGKKPTSIRVYQSNFLYGVGTNQWNGNFLMSTPDQLVDPNLRGSLVTTFEFGIDLKFIKNRYGINFSYYIEDNDGEPLAVTTSGVAGYTSKLVNAAHIKREGFELILHAKPLTNVRNFDWNITKTFGYIVKNPVVKLIDGQDRIIIPSTSEFNSGAGAFGTRFARAFQQVGKDWGQLIGGGIKRNAEGLPLIKINSQTGLPTGEYVNDENKEWGSVIPKATGGLVNSFSWKDLTLNFSIDYQVGGKFFSLSENWGHYSGLLEATAFTNDKGKNVRDAVQDGGGVRVIGVFATDGRTPVDMYIPAQDYYHNFYNSQVGEPYIHDLTFVKLREVALGYNIPVQKLGNIGKIVKGANFSVVSRNTWLIYRDAKNFDPSEISGVQGEDGQYPGTRSIGATLKLRF